MKKISTFILKNLHISRKSCTFAGFFTYNVKSKLEKIE